LNFQSLRHCRFVDTFVWELGMEQGEGGVTMVALVAVVAIVGLGNENGDV